MAGDSQGSQNSSGANQGGAQGGGGSDAVQQMLQDHQQRFESMGNELQTTRQQAESFRQQSEKTAGVLDRIKGALTGDQAPKLDPDDEEIAHYQGQIDEYIAAAIEAERRGKPIPVTINAAIKSFQGQIARIEQIKELKGRLSGIEGKVNQAADPQNQINMQAYSNIDSFTINALQQVYGAGQDMEDVRNAQFKSVASLLTAEIKSIQKDAPDLWDRIRRNPEDQKRIVTHYVKQVVPPRARELMEQDTIRKTPITLPDLKTAWDEAKEIEDPAVRAEIQAKLRPQMLEHIYSRSRNSRGQDQQQRTGINDLF